MQSPEPWRAATAKDGAMTVATLPHDDGSVSIRLSIGGVSMVAAVEAGDFARLFAFSSACK